MAAKDRTLAAAGMILAYAALIGFTDNHVRTIAAEAGLWQFHLTRSLMALALLAAVAPVLGLRLKPRSWRAVAARRRSTAARCWSISEPSPFCQCRWWWPGCSPRRSSSC